MGLSLADVARRAGTSAATVSRYESGWTRFETYTLRKLASALSCGLHIEMVPLREAESARAGPQEALRAISRLFWDGPLTEGEVAAGTQRMIERVLDFGSLADVHMLQRLMGRGAFLRAVAATGRLAPRTRAFWSRVLAMEGITCTPRYSRNTAWIY